MSHHRHRFEDAEWRPHPFALAVYAAGVALLAWSVYAYAHLPAGPAGAGLQREAWRPTASKLSRASATGGQRVSRASDALARDVSAGP